MLHFELMCVYDVRKGSSFIHLNENIQLFWQPFVENYSFPCELSWHLCWNSVDLECKGYFYFCAINSVSLIIYIYIFISIYLIYLYVYLLTTVLLYCSLVVSLEIEKCEFSNFVLSQDSFGYWLLFPCEFTIGLKDIYL